MNAVSTKYGVFLPCSDASDLRKKYRCPVDFYDNGRVRSIYLQEPVKVDFPAGRFQAELLTFYEDGSIKRVFPLYGQISAYWSIEDELNSAPYYDFVFEENSLRMRPQCLFFYPSGKIRSITLWPDDTVNIKTSVGCIKTKLGIELYEAGSIRSIEPVFGTVVRTEYGDIKPFVYHELMMHSEYASMVFYEDGGLKSFSTIGSEVVINGTVYKPGGYLLPLMITFGDKKLTVRRGDGLNIEVDPSRNDVIFR